MNAFRIALLCFPLLSCDEGNTFAQATCVLVDTSGSYVSEVTPAVQLVKLSVLPHVTAGDTLIVARIDGESYDKTNIVSVMTVDQRPSQGNAQKHAFATALEDFARTAVSSRHTDISGGVMLCADYLRETRARHQTILVLSDMEEDLPSGIHRDLQRVDLKGVHVVALNVKRLRADNSDPTRYRARMQTWEQTLTAAGAAGFHVVEDGSRLDALMEAWR